MTTSKEPKQPSLELIRRDVLAPYLSFYGLAGDGTPQERAERLIQFWIDQKAEIQLATCTECGGDSDARLRECPFCGEPGEAVKAKAVEGTDQSIEIADNDEAVIEPPAGATEGDLDDAIETVKRLNSHLGKTAYDLGMTLRRIRDTALWRLRLDKFRLPRYRTFYDFAELEIGLRRGACRRWIRICEEYTREQVERYGVTRLAAALRLPDGEREPFLEEVLKDVHGARGPEVVAAARKKQLEIDNEQGQDDTQDKQKPQRKVKATPTPQANTEQSGAPESNGWPKFPTGGKTYRGGIPLGRARVPLWRRATDGSQRVDEYTGPAVSTEEDPWIRVRINDDLHMRFITTRNDQGELEAIIEFREVRVVGSS